MQAIQDQMKSHGQEPVLFEDVKDEVFDMIKPSHPFKVTLQDLIQWLILLCYIKYTLFF